MGRALSLCVREAHNVASADVLAEEAHQRWRIFGWYLAIQILFFKFAQDQSVKRFFEFLFTNLFDTFIKAKHTKA